MTGGLPPASEVAHGAGSVLQVVDVAPDSPFGTPDKIGFDPSGRTMTVVVDPQTPAYLYAASEYSGVWRSTDAARHWQWASTGLTTGHTILSGEALAIDANDPL